METKILGNWNRHRHSIELEEIETLGLIRLEQLSQFFSILALEVVSSSYYKFRNSGFINMLPFEKKCAEGRNATSIPDFVSLNYAKSLSNSLAFL